MSEGKSDEGRDHGRDSVGDGRPTPRPTGSGGDGKTTDQRAKGPTPDSSKTAPGRESGLTERQRRQARELRRKRTRSKDRGKSPVGSRTGSAISRGLKATATETGRALGFLGRGAGRAIGTAGAFLLALLEVVLVVGAAIFARAGRAVGAIAAALGRASLALDRILTPARAVIAVSILAGVLLGVSQFLDYRAVEIGGSGYETILDLTRAPRTDVETPIGAHSFILLFVAVAAVGCCLGLAFTGRRALALPVAAAGVIALAVGLAIDLPRGLDSASASVAYADAQPVLLSGFWLEIASGVVLAAAGLMMALSPSGAEARSRRRATPSDRGTTDRRDDRRRNRDRAAAGGTA